MKTEQKPTNGLTDKELRELDAWIWTHVLGWVPFREEEYPHRNGYALGDDTGEKCLECDMPQCSTDPAAAMQVLEKCAVELGGEGERACAVEWLPMEEEWRIIETDTPDGVRAQAKTLPLAICLFAKELFSTNATSDAPLEKHQAEPVA